MNESRSRARTIGSVTMNITAARFILEKKQIIQEMIVT